MIRNAIASGRNRSPTRGFGAAAVVVAMLVVAAGCGDGEEDVGDAETGPPGPTCEYDDSEGPESSLDLEVGERKEGYICPVGDEDWYEFEVDESRSILRVSLEMSSKLTEVRPTYAIREVDDDGNPGEVVASPPGGRSQKQLEVEHCLDAGRYQLVVRDRGNDDSELRHWYNLSLETASNPDDAEPNDSRSDALELNPDTPQEGYVACRGDADWYRLQVPSDRVIRFELTAGKLDYQPTATLYEKGEEGPVARVTNRSSPRKKTDLQEYVVAPGGGVYYLEVSDNDDKDADSSAPYTVRYELLEDSDPNEPNDEAAEATEADSRTACGSSWQTALDARGTVGAPNDEDWYRVPLQGCRNGVVEVSMEVETAGLSKTKQWELQDEIQASATLIRPDPKSSCSSDADCRLLEGRSCQTDLDCSGWFEQCASQGKCTGATECLERGICGAKQVQRNYECNEAFEECDPSSGLAPPPNRVEFAAPILGRGDVVYVRAGDYQSNGSAPDRLYSLEVRVRNDPDSNEPNNVFSNAPERGASPTQHREKATPIPIYDCAGGAQPTAGTLDGAETADASDASDAPMSVDTGLDTDADGLADASRDTTPTDTSAVDATDGTDSTDAVDTANDTTGDIGGGDADGGGYDLPDGCCANRKWVSGRISYQNDQDWFEYRHPCPGSDCTIRVHYQVEGGPVDTAINIYREGTSSPWLSAYDVDQQQSQMPRNGTFGGTSQQDRCAYAFQGHRDADGIYRYGINVSDEVESQTRGPVTKTNPNSRDWAPGQEYSICVEKISNECAEPPCKQYENGCGPPQNND